MEADRWQRLEAVFHAALAQESGRRAAFLDDACVGDEGLRREVESLLEAHEREGGVLELELSLLPTIAVGPVREESGPEPGTVVEGRYRIDALLARGGMGAVYRATHLALDRTVALKVVRGALLADGRMTESLMREARTISHLKHPHIVTVHDFGSAPEVGMYLVMELVEGRSLGAELGERGRLEVGQAVEVMRQVCSAVDAAHEAGVIHRDLKPDNIVLERGSGGLVAKVLDFGIAQLQAGGGEGESPWQPSVVAGTPAYMAPEQCCGEGIDARTDVYALGCVLYEMLLGHPPFRAGSAAQVMAKQVTEQPTRPSQERSEIPAELEAAVLRALAKDPDERFQTAAELGRALGAPEAAVASVAPNNLPQSLTHFVGRGEQIGELSERLTGVRLLTLVGPGGIGKTRLALEVGAQVLETYTDGVWVVELAACTDAALVPGTIAATLGIREEAGRALAETLVEWLRDRRLLLVLDNCEHIVEACARLAEQLLRRCPRLRVLATSREPLGITGEAVLAVPALTEEEATRLFVERATMSGATIVASERNAATIAQVCRRLDGIPLAIELAAARTRALTVEQIEAKLDDRFRLLTGGSRTAPSRQQTLRATLDWSYALLEGAEQILLRRLSVFAGGWTLESAECLVLSAESEEPSSTQHSALSTQHSPSTQHFDVLDVLDVLAQLVNRSLVVAVEQGDESRYRMLETVREYARERLGESGETEVVARRHAEHFLAMAEAAEPELPGARAPEWIDRLEAEHDNLRAALEWWLDRYADSCLHLAGALSVLWVSHGHLTEGRRWLEAALERSSPASSAPRAKALRQTGTVALRQGDLAAARAHYEESLRIDRERGDALQVGLSSQGLGAVAHLQGDLRAARAYLEESIASGRAFGHSRLIADSLTWLGEGARLEGEWAEARRLYEEALEISKQTGRSAAVSMALCNLGAVACEEGDLRAARSHYTEALAIEQGLGSTEGIAESLDGLAAVALGQGASTRAAWLAGAAQALRDEIGAEQSSADRAFRDRYLARVRERLGEEAFEAAQTEGRAMALERAVECALESD